MNSSLLAHLNNCPPFVLYYLSRDSKAHLDHPDFYELARRTKAYGHPISPRTIERLSQSITWAGVKVAVVDAYCFACRVEFVRVVRQRRTALIAAGTTGRVMTTCAYLITPFKRYLYRLASQKIKNPLTNLTTRQRRRFDTLCVRWVAAREQRPKLQ